MNAPEQGFLLLTSSLGDPTRPVLTVPQFRTLAQRVRQMEKPDTIREMTVADLVALGYGQTMAQRILTLLSQTEQLRWYLDKARKRDCCPISRISQGYPPQLRKRLALDSPGCLWAKGDLSLLQCKAVALVGCRDLLQNNLAFAREAGKQAALQGFVLISGNARGADREAQEACLSAGGNVISVIADSLEKCPLQRNLLFLSEDGFDCAFTPQRALSRNRIIHCLGSLTLVAQSDLRKGGTWDGTSHNLRHKWTQVYCFDDNQPATQEFVQMGASPITLAQLTDFSALTQGNFSFF